MNSMTDLCLIPAVSAPNGQKSNFDDPASLAPAIMAVLTIMVLWATIFTAARLYINVRKLNVSDFFALAGLLMSIAILAMVATQLRTARHIWDVPACYFDASFARGVYIPALLLNLGAFFAKTAIFLLFNQLFTIHKPMRIAIWSGITFTFLIYGAGVAVATYYETPHIGETWMDVLDGRAIVPLKWWQAQSALTIALDIYIFILPLPAISKLRISFRRRIQLIAVFSLALMGIGASVASLVERIAIQNAKDVTWISAILSLCSAVELNVAIIVSCAPGFASFTRSHVPKLSSFAFSFRSNSKVFDSEAVLIRSKSKSNGSDSKRSDRMVNDPALGGDRKYFELNDRWALRSEATTDEAVLNGEMVNGRIMRTTAVEQDVRPVSTEHLVR